jgi:Cu/Ag efflux protein CusF
MRRVLSLLAVGAALSATAVYAPAQEKAVPPPMKEVYTAPAYAGEKVTVVATVEAVDLATREVTLRGPEGNTVTITAGEEVRNLPQVKVGDRVEVTYYQGLALELGPSGSGIQKRTEVVTARRAEPGEKPGGAVLQTVTATGTVKAIDPKARTVTIRGAKRTLVLKVAENVDLGKVKVGDEVQALYQQAMAISVKAAEAK